MAKPIEEFKTQEELNQCLKWWQEKLFLNDWVIKGYLVHGEEIPELGGESNVQWVNQCGTIKIRYANEQPDGIMKQPHELILIHELLHFKYMGFEGVSTIEGVFYEEKQHQLLEQMAKSLIMAKYDIGFDYFVEED